MIIHIATLYIVLLSIILNLTSSIYSRVIRSTIINAAFLTPEKPSKKGTVILRLLSAQCSSIC